MTIRKKILLYFSLTISLLIGLSFLFIFSLFAEYREEEFQQRQEDKINSTLKFLKNFGKNDSELAQAIDAHTIHDFFDEKMNIYDQNKQLIYTSIDNLLIDGSEKILKNLSPENRWIETKEAAYDVVGIYTEKDGKGYYGISKAYDMFGYSKLSYLRNVLILSFVLIILTLVLISMYLSKKITKPITDLASKISNYDFEKPTLQISIDQIHLETNLLTKRFNELLERINAAFNFQKHAINHISHELKTPIAILVSNFEKIEEEKDEKEKLKLLEIQKQNTLNLGKIINILLEIAKADASQQIKKESIRVDEMVFDIVEELRLIHPDFNFQINYTDEHLTEEDLSILANEALVKAALMNLMLNAIQYNDSNLAEINFSKKERFIDIIITNSGPIITDQEKPFMFKHFFRGQSGKSAKGFGLGLVFIEKIAHVHQGKIAYSNQNAQNVFTLSLPI